LIGDAVETAAITSQWTELIRLKASIEAGVVIPSVILRKLSAAGAGNALSRALRAVGRIERTLFIYVTWNQVWARCSVFWGATWRSPRRWKSVGRSWLASPQHSRGWPSVRPRSRSAHARRLLSGSFRVLGVLYDSIDRPAHCRTW
jgi:Tn3 transposase DDE domain